MWRIAVKFSVAAQFSAICAVQCSALQCSVVQYSVVPGSAM